jgi:hypothetical protein
MKLQKERELLVFVYIDQKGLVSLDDIRKELELKDDPEFEFDTTVSELVKEEYVKQTENLSWEITEWGEIQFSDLKIEKYEDLNKMSYLIRAVIIVIAILAFIKIFPRMFH